LPTDEEWERAARGAEGREYPWGNEEPDPNRANYDEGKVGAPTPVGLYPKGATPEGIMDMAGNVWEWTADWYEDNVYRSVRWGSWIYLSKYLRAAYRDRVRRDFRNDNIGFRCVREIPLLFTLYSFSFSGPLNQLVIREQNRTSLLVARQPLAYAAPKPRP
jgi:serine/threonine-protein kinase